MKVLLLLCVVCSSLQVAFSQDGQMKESADWNRGHSISLNLGPLANLVNGGLGLSYEIPVGKDFAVQGELGAIFFSLGENYENESHNGYRLGANVKYYFAVNNRTALYFKGAFKFIRATDWSYETLRSPGGNWQEEYLLKGTFKSYGPSLQFGGVGFLDSSNRFFYDYSGGLGLLYWAYPIEDFPAGYELVDQGLRLLKKGSSGTYPDPIFQFKLGFFLSAAR